MYSKGTEWTFNVDAVRTPRKWDDRQLRANGSARDYAKGKIPDDVFQLNGLMPWATKATGYPTQKPVALAERIIKANTNSGDVVLDCFAGCAYSAIAAERLGRRWTACDLNPRAWTVFKRQFIKTKLLNPPLECDDATAGQQILPSDRKAQEPGKHRRQQRYTEPLPDVSLPQHPQE